MYTVRSPDEVLLARGTEVLDLGTTGALMGFFKSESESESELELEEDSDLIMH